VDFRLAERLSGSGIWFGERSCGNGEQRHCINEESVHWIYLDIQNEKWKTNLNQKNNNLYYLSITRRFWPRPTLSKQWRGQDLSVGWNFIRVIGQLRGNQIRPQEVQNEQGLVGKFEC
jgi:hypothetical protein